MKIIITESQLSLLKESILRTNLKGKNVLCHSTPIDKFLGILIDNKIKGLSRQSINHKYSKDNPNYNEKQNRFFGSCFTRDSELWFNDIQFMLDGDLMKRDFGGDLMPFDFHSDENIHKADPKRLTYEKEEFLLGDLYPLDKYLVGMRVVIESEFQVFLEEGNVTLFQELLSSFNVRLYNTKFQDITQEILDYQPHQEIKSS